MDPRVKLISTVRCPKCGFESPEQMPERYCLVRYECKMCGHIMFPGEGKCCIFCTFGDVKCPSMQEIDLKAKDEGITSQESGREAEESASGKQSVKLRLT